MSRNEGETRQRKFIERLIHPWRVFCLSVNEMFHGFYEKNREKSSNEDKEES
jgi:hypothetical protein